MKPIRLVYKNHLLPPLVPPFESMKHYLTAYHP